MASPTPCPYSFGFQYRSAAKNPICWRRPAARGVLPPALTVQDFAAGLNAISTSRTSIFATFAPSLIPAFATSA
jgi:hypothetical protein